MNIHVQDIEKAKRAARVGLAIADGDIGQHFPDSDPRWRGADSRELLRSVMTRVAEAGSAFASWIPTQPIGTSSSE